MATFIALIFWAYSKKRKRQFDEAANLPFADDEENNATLRKESEKRED
jgi:cytochrome c oxidase cbb3-type subunit 4